MGIQAMKRQTASCDWLSEQIAESLAEEMGPEHPHISRLAQSVLDRLRRRLGGAYVYIPSAIDARQMEIRAQFNGRNAPEVASANGVTVRTVYRLTNGKK